MTKIEHVNLTVPDIDAALDFLKIVAPDFSVRRDDVAGIEIKVFRGLFKAPNLNGDTCLTQTTGAQLFLSAIWSNVQIILRRLRCIDFAHVIFQNCLTQFVLVNRCTTSDNLG